MINPRVAMTTALLAAIVTVPNAISAAPLGVSKASQEVTALIRSSDAACPDNVALHHLVSVRLASDGTQVPFVIPPKSVFVVTSYEYVVTTASPSTFAGASVLAAAANQSTPGAAAPAATIADSTGRAFGTLLTPNGLVVRPPAAPCGEFSTGVTGTIFVHGFFAPDK